MDHSRLLTGLLISGLALQAITLGGCYRLITNDKRYSSSFDDAHDFAEYWCGPCEEVDTYTPEDGLTIHKMKDKEYSFTYYVSEIESSQTAYSYTSYNIEDFGYYYLLEFLDKAELSGLIDEYDLTIKVDEPYRPNKERPELCNYTPELIISTDRTLSGDDNKKIATALLDELKRFDSGREVFTKENDNTYVNIEIRSAALPEDLGARWHLEITTYGFEQ